MLRLRRDQPSLWESVLPEDVLRLSQEPTKVDALLEDERFLKCRIHTDEAKAIDKAAELMGKLADSLIPYRY